MLQHLRPIAIAALTMLGTIAFAAPVAAGDLFTVVDTLAPHPGSYLQWAVRIDSSELRKNGRITLPIPGAYLEAVPDRIERRGPDDLTWRGRTRNGGQVVLTAGNDAIYGIVYDGTDMYELVPTAGGQVLRHVLDDRPCGTDEPSGPFPESAISRDRLAAAANEKAATTTELRALYLYTQEVEDKAGGAAEVAVMVQGAVDQLNTAFSNSSMDIHATLVGLEKVPFTESGDLVDDLMAIRDDAAAIDLRSRHQGNYVGLLVSRSDYWCGYSYVMRNPGPDFEPNAFHVTWLRCLYLDHHEVGHTLGFEHDPETSSVVPTIASFPYSFGHRTEGQYRTVMSYSCGTEPCISINQFSNPDVVYDDWPTGVSDERDNARTGRSTAPIVAQFYYDPSASLLFQDGFEDGTTGTWSSTDQ